MEDHTMGVRRSDWIIIGVNIGYDVYGKADDNVQNDLLDSEFYDNAKVNKITYLIDGYSGEYFIVGQVIRVDKDGCSGLSLTEFSLNENDYPVAERNAKQHIKEHFGLDVEPRLIVLTHWT
jgi:hypothetical protein